jgi:hypothetical protein
MTDTDDTLTAAMPTQAAPARQLAYSEVDFHDDDIDSGEESSWRDALGDAARPLFFIALATFAVVLVVLLRGSLSPVQWCFAGVGVALEAVIVWAWIASPPSAGNGGATS